MAEPIPLVASGQQRVTLASARSLLAIALVVLLSMLGAACQAPRSDRSTVTPVVIPSSSPPVGEGNEDLRTIYLWNPNSGVVRAVHSARGAADNAELSPDGKSLVYERRPALGEPSQIYVLGPDGVERALTHHGARALTRRGLPTEARSRLSPNVEWAPTPTSS